MSATLRFVSRTPGAEVLIVTNMWPERDRPVYGIHVQRTVQGIEAAGVQCDVLYLRGYETPLAYPAAAALFFWTSLAWRRRYRLIHVNTAEAGIAARFHLGTPMIVTYLGDDILGNRRGDGTVPALAALRARLVRAHSALFDRTITVSAEMESVLPARARRRNRVIPQGVDPQRFRPMSREETRAKLGWSSTEAVALFAATKPESPAKRLQLARESCEHAGVRLHVASGVDPDTLPLLMNSADCLLVTSAVEGSPNVVKEALMCNLPVISTRVGDVEKLLSGVSPSWLCEPNREDLARALRECVAERRRSNGRGAAGWVRADAVTAQILDVYREVADVRVSDARV